MENKIIYIVIPYFSNSQEINHSLVKSFCSFEKAEEYTWTLYTNFDIIENELNNDQLNGLDI